MAMHNPGEPPSGTGHGSKAANPGEPGLDRPHRAPRPAVR